VWTLHPRSQKRNLHPTDEDLSVGTPVWGTQSGYGIILSKTLHCGHAHFATVSFTVSPCKMRAPAEGCCAITEPDLTGGLGAASP